MAKREIIAESRSHAKKRPAVLVGSFPRWCRESPASDARTVVTAITSTTANGISTNGQSVALRLSFSEPVTITGTLRVTLDTGTILSLPP